MLTEAVSAITTLGSRASGGAGGLIGPVYAIAIYVDVRIRTACLPASAGTVHVRGYTKADGTYVPPHERSSPNSTTTDNWSVAPNVNPYTGAQGTKSPDAPPPKPKPKSVWGN